MAKRIISCEDCSHWEEVTAKNAKRCYVCRLARNLEFMRDRKGRCWLCEEQFCPTARDDQLCGKCCISLKSAQEIVCVYCRESKLSVAKDIAVCVVCARDVKHRRKFLKAVTDKRSQRQATPPGPKPEPPTPVVEPVVEI